MGNHRYRILLKWCLYSALFLLVLLLTTVVLGSRTFLGVKLSLVPVYVACVACREGHEAGGFFALALSLIHIYPLKSPPRPQAGSPTPQAAGLRRTSNSAPRPESSPATAPAPSGPTTTLQAGSWPKCCW